MGLDPVQARLACSGLPGEVPPLRYPPKSRPQAVLPFAIHEHEKVSCLVLERIVHADCAPYPSLSHRQVTARHDKFSHRSANCSATQFLVVRGSGDEWPTARRSLTWNLGSGLEFSCTAQCLTLTASKPKVSLLVLSERAVGETPFNDVASHKGSTSQVQLSGSTCTQQNLNRNR